MKQVIVGLVAVCAVAVLAVGLWVLFQPRTYHATECGIGTGGPCAKVTVTNRTAGLGRTQVPIQVDFRYAGRNYGYADRHVVLPALGSVTAVMVPARTNKHLAPATHAVDNLLPASFV